MDLTLTLDDELAARLRVDAAQHDTTLGRLVVGQLRRLYETEDRLAAWAQRTREHGGHAGPGYRSRREDCY
jgi:plasmid stability protein